MAAIFGSLVSKTQPRKLQKRSERHSVSVLRDKSVNTIEPFEIVNRESWSGDRSSKNKPQITKHQRSYSLDAVLHRSRDSENYMVPAVPPVPVDTKYKMGSVVGQNAAYMPHNAGFGSASYAGGEFANRSSAMGIQRPDGITRNAYEAMPRPTRALSMQPGSYAQFDNRVVTTYDRFGRPSTSNSNASTTITRESFEARMRQSTSSRTSIESRESYMRRPESGWQRPAPIKQHRRKAQPWEQFSALPDEVLNLIMGALRTTHLAEGSFSCATCMMRDLCSIALSSRRLLKSARQSLYEDILLVGSDSQAQKKRYKINHGSRMTLLRRTLRSNSDIAALVRTLKAPNQPQGMAVDQYLNQIASIIMACPNFERLVGPHQSYDHNFNRLFHALSTRDKLKEMTWVVEASSAQRQGRSRSPLDTDVEDLLPQQSTAFLNLNMNWSHLKTLSIHCLPGAVLTPVSLVLTAISTMPALQNLYLSHLSTTSFDDTDLLSLPPLKTLSLSNLPGVTSSGLSTFVTRQSSQSIRKLTLQHMNMDSLPALARLFLNLKSLETFTLVQPTTPVLPDGELIWLFPYIASRTLSKLHWDLTGPQTCTTQADSILAQSIAADGFPSLRVLRVPNDHDGLFQNLCKPIEKVEKPGDRFRGRGLVSTIDSGAASPRTPTSGKSQGKSPNKAYFADFPGSTTASNLHTARLAAQKRIEEAQKDPRVTVNVIDEDGTLLENWKMAGFIGQIGSQIRYCLAPDPGATDESGGVVQFADILDDSREELKDREGCTGRWNNYGYVNYDRKDKEMWWHTERAMWTEVRLQ